MTGTRDRSDHATPTLTRNLCYRAFLGSMPQLSFRCALRPTSRIGIYCSHMNPAQVLSRKTMMHFIKKIDLLGHQQSRMIAETWMPSKVRRKSQSTLLREKSANKIRKSKSATLLLKKRYHDSLSMDLYMPTGIYSG